MEKAIVLLMGVLGSATVLALPTCEGFDRPALAGLGAGAHFSLPVSCYQVDDAGSACGVFDACCIRRAGVAASGIVHPTRYPQHA